MVFIASSSSSTHPAALESACLPALLIVRLQRVRVQVNDLQACKVRLKIAERHPELAVVLNTQSHCRFLFVRYKLPLRGPFNILYYDFCNSMNSGSYWSLHAPSHSASFPHGLRMRTIGICPLILGVWMFINLTLVMLYACPLASVSASNTSGSDCLCHYNIKLHSFPELVWCNPPQYHNSSTMISRTL